jgi:CubicO group peptidase (beta-lactamase class C family)
MSKLLSISFRRIFIGLTALAAGLAAAQDIPWANSAEDVGMSSERLQRINTVMQRHIDAGDIQGAITVVARQGQLVHFETHGLMDVDNSRPMQEDSIFIMMSSTKPVLGVAAMMMIEEGLMRPEDPVSKYIPEFADMQSKFC